MNDRFVVSVDVPGRIETVRPVAAFLVALAQRLQVAAAADTLFENAIVEALNNALEHTNRQGQTSLHCEFELEGRRLSIRVLDPASEGPVALPQASALALPMPESWRDVPESGYGLYLMRAVFPDVRPVTRDGRFGVEMSLTL
jgi:anti-sigma regulatory factor (Ser/Thr protein kinase)